MPSPFTWNPNVPAPTDLIKIFPTTPQYVQDKLTLAQVLGTLTPTGGATTGFRIYQIGSGIFLTFNCATFTGGAYTQDDASLPTVIWYANHADGTVFCVAYGAPGSTAIASYPLILREDNTLTIAGVSIFNSSPSFRTGAAFGGSYQSAFDASGNLAITGQSLVTGPSYHRGVSFFGTADQASINGSGWGKFTSYLDCFGSASWDSWLRLGYDNNNLYAIYVDNANIRLNVGGRITSGTWAGGPAFYIDTSFFTTFLYQVIFNAVVLHHGIAYFGASNQATIDASGNAAFPSLAVSGNSVHSGPSYHRGAASYFGSGDQSAFTSAGNLQAASPGINYISFGGNWHAFKWNGTNVEAWVNGSTLAGVIPIPSDEKLKRNITESRVDALKELNALDLYEFDMLSRENDPAFVKHHSLGLIAQRVKKTLPEAVIESSDKEKDDVSFIDNQSLVAYLIKAVQQLTKKVERLEAQLA